MMGDMFSAIETSMVTDAEFTMLQKAKPGSTSQEMVAVRIPLCN